VFRVVAVNTGPEKFNSYLSIVKTGYLLQLEILSFVWR
jgi:hypothetical protein